MIRRTAVILSALIFSLTLYLGRSRTVGSFNELRETVLSSHSISLNNRYGNKFVSDVMKDNILLTIRYMENSSLNARDISWNEVEKPFTYRLNIAPGSIFAFHDDILPEYQAYPIITTHAHFIYDEGFKSDGYLAGDGVCHLASLMYWVAKDAGLDAVAPTNHDFARIPGISRQFGVAIYSRPGESSTNEKQNLYIRNNTGRLISFIFKFDGDNLSLSLVK